MKSVDKFIKNDMGRVITACMAVYYDAQAPFPNGVTRGDFIARELFSGSYINPPINKLNHNIVPCVSEALLCGLC